MFGGNWTEDLWVMAFSGKLEGLGLAFNDKMQPMWMAESGTVTHMLDRMLGLYPTKAPVTNAMELMSELKPGDKTCTEHFQYLVYVAEKFRTRSCCSACVSRRWATPRRVQAELLTCAQSNQSRVNQSRKDTGKNATVDKIGDVICSIKDRCRGKIETAAAT
ncbi:hypothetical protein PR003_g10577 [Phytophthora rubi]|uniref:Uncharacterized protein n=1 Tax=Phytophthora rubi TaxID=129364 RepID=A0A6A4FDU3_9STRA|nr:hypothetical protein PR003_g10577 [Phytophthora rubi]